MKQIRCGLFETNSSSVHSITLMTKKDYEDWISHKIAIKFTLDFDEEKSAEEFDNGRTGEIEGFEEWGNHSVDAYYYDKVNIEDRILASVGSLIIESRNFEDGDFISPEEMEEYVSVRDLIKGYIQELIKTEKIPSEVLRGELSDCLYLTPEEYKEINNNPQFFSGYNDELVLIGYYSRT